MDHRPGRGGRRRRLADGSVAADGDPAAGTAAGMKMIKAPPRSAPGFDNDWSVQLPRRTCCSAWRSNRIGMLSSSRPPGATSCRSPAAERTGPPHRQPTVTCQQDTVEDFCKRHIEVPDLHHGRRGHEINTVSSIYHLNGWIGRETQALRIGGLCAVRRLYCEATVRGVSDV